MSSARAFPAIAVGLLALASMGPGIVRAAQEKSPPAPSTVTEPAEPLQLEPFVVTGSLIKRTDFEGPSPIQVITRQEIDRVAGTGLVEILCDLPEVTNLAINENNTTTMARGVSALDLRSLGAANTLLLVDGRRQASNGISANTTTFVDLNRFPTAMIERIEVLKDGASAVYGADATAGVVNLILRKNYAGVELSGRYGNYLRTDGAETSWALVAGRTVGRFRALLGLTRSTRNAIAAADLPVTANADQTEIWRAIAPAKYADKLQPTATCSSYFDGRSGAGPFATVFVPTAAQLAHSRNGFSLVAIRNPLTGATATFLPGTGGVPQGTLGNSSSNAASVPRENNPGRPTAEQFVTRAYLPGDYGNSYNYQPFVWNTSETARTGAHLRLDCDLTRTLSMHATLSWMRQQSVTHLAPSPMSTAADNALLVPASNYYNPFGIPVAFTYRALEVGPRIGRIDSNTVSVYAGLQGRLRDRFEWDLGWSYSCNRISDITDNQISETRLRAALAKNTPDALNIFGGLAFRNDPATLEGLKVSAGQSGDASTALADLHVSTIELFTLPGGAVGASASLEHRLERYNITNDPLISMLDDIVGMTRLFEAAHARRDVQSTAAEVRLPLVPADRWTWLRSVELSGAARFEMFSEGYDSGVKPFAGLRVRLGSGLLLRASQGRVFRAPSLVQLYGGGIDQTVSGIADLRRPATLTGDSFDGSTTPRLLRQGGNPLLTPENGTTRQAGLVFDVPGRLFRGLTLEFTHGQIEQDGVIRGSLGVTYIQQNELAGTATLVFREAGTQTFTNTTAAPINVLSGPAGETTPVQPGQSATVPGRITMILDAAINLAHQVVRYDDYGLRWRRPTAAWGTFILSSNWTYYEFYAMQPTPVSPLTTGVGRYVPRYRNQSSVTWQRGRWGADVGLNYNHRYREFVRDGFEVGRYYTISAGLNHTLADDIRWRALRGMHVSLGIENLLDREPPSDGTAGLYNQGFIGRPAGRYVFVSFRQAL